MKSRRVDIVACDSDLEGSILGGWVDSLVSCVLGKRPRYHDCTMRPSRLNTLARLIWFKRVPNGLRKPSHFLANEFEGY